MGPVSFHVPDIDTEVPRDLVGILLGELDLIVREGAPFDAKQAAQTIRDVESGAISGPVNLTDSEHLAVIRALDNLRRGGVFPAPLPDLRDRLRGNYSPPTVTYSVRTLTEDIGSFASYAGEFEIGDRLLLQNEAWSVIRIDHDERHDRPRLVVDAFDRDTM